MRNGIKIVNIRNPEAFGLWELLLCNECFSSKFPVLSSEDDELWLVGWPFELCELDTQVLNGFPFAKPGARVSPSLSQHFLKGLMRDSEKHSVLRLGS